MDPERTPAADWPRQLAAGRARYAQLGWPVTVEVGNRVLVRAVDDTVGGLSMPAELASRVRDALGIAMLCGPVIAAPDGRRWTFLTKPLPGLRPHISADLVRLNIVLAPPGGHIVLPASPTATATGRRWIEPPAAARSLPPPYAVIGIARRLSDPPALALGA
jgi:hypothetical protein